MVSFARTKVSSTRCLLDEDGHLEKLEKYKEIIQKLKIQKIKPPTPPPPPPRRLPPVRRRLPSPPPPAPLLPCVIGVSVFKSSPSSSPVRSPTTSVCSTGRRSPPSLVLVPASRSETGVGPDRPLTTQAAPGGWEKEKFEIIKRIEEIKRFKQNFS